MKFTGDEFRLRDISCRAIVKQLCDHPGQTRAGLAQQLALPKSSVISVVRQLLHDGWLQERDSRPTGSRGRPSSLLHLRPDRLMLLGAQLGCHGVRAVATTLTGELLADARCEPGEAGDVAGTLAAAARLLGQLEAQLRTPERRVVAIGVAVPGRVDAAGACLTAAAEPAWQHLPVARLLHEKLRGLPLQDLPLHLQGEPADEAEPRRGFGAAAAAPCPPQLAAAVAAAGFARHRLLHPLRPPSRLPALVARYGHRYSAPALHAVLEST